MINAVGYVIVGTIVIGATLVGSLGIKVGVTLPDHAMLLADSQSKTYVTVPCVVRGRTDQSYVANVDAVVAGTEDVWYEPFVGPVSKREARELGYRPDKMCADADGFVVLVPWLFQLIGATKPRVAEDGTVLW